MKKHLFHFLTFVLLLLPPSLSAQVNEYLSFYCSWASSTVTPTAVGTPDVNLEYSTDKANWTPVTMGTAIDIHTAKVYFRGNNPDGFSKSMTDYVWFNIYVSSNTCTVAGNVMSLVGGAAFAANSTTIPNEYCFYRLFSSGAKVSYNYINASALTLPANNLTTGCYREMFFYTGIVNLPQLPAQNLADYCYYKMFYRCLNIATMTTDGVNYVLPAEELKPHCYEYMFGFYNESLSTTFRCEIMATSCQDRTGNDIEKCLASMFNFEVNGTKSWNVYLYIYFKTLGNTSSATCPTYDWFWGTKNTSRNYIYYDSGINSTTKRNSSNNSPYGAFPYGCTLYSTSYTYLTFDCKTNGGTWESGSAYNTDLRRVVRANYTAKTIPAPPVKENARFLGWFTSASGDGSLLTEEYLKTVTTATTVYARFVDNDKYTFFVNPSDKATITVTDNSSNSYTPGTLYILDSNDKTFTLSCTGVTSGYTFYRWLGGLVDGNTVQFREGQKDMVVTGVITAAPAFGSASVTVYQVGTGAGTSSVVPLPSEAVDLGDAGIWAKYNVDNTQSNGFATSETATGGYYSWGMETAATASEVNALYSSMADGDNLPVTEEADVAYKYCGHKWRIPTKDEWQTLLDNTTVVGPTNTNNNNSTVSGKMQTFTSNSNGNQMILPPNGYYSGTTGPYFGNSIQYWSSTRGLTQSKGNTAYGYGGGLSSSTIVAPTLGNTTVGGSGTGYYYYAVGIRPILNVNKRVLTIHTLDFDDDEQPLYHHYFFEADLNQSITVTAVEDDGNVFDHWADSEGNLYSEDNPLTLPMYDNVELTAVFEAGSLVEHHVTFYDEDGSTVLWEDDYREGKKPVYHGETPTKAGYVFNGWSPAITKLGDSDTYYTATYIQVFTVTASAAHGTVTVTPGDPSDQVSENVYKTGTTLTLTVTPDAGWVFTQWTGGNSSNPRSVSVTGDASYTAEFRLESLPATVDAYQSAPADVKQIVYLLTAQTGDDDKTYTPVDLGVGVAFADRNVGAATTNATGDYFMWGKTTAATSGFTSANQLSATGLYDGYTLTAEQDAATQNMGSHWRMPTDVEWVELKNTATISADKSTFTNPNDNTKHITLPATGYYSTATKYQSSYRFYWSSVTYYLNSSNIFPWTLENYETNSQYFVSVTYNGNNSIYRYYGMPVRAVYVPPYTPVRLTINAGERQYVYYCQPGQQVTVTAHPNTAANYLFDEWEDNHSDNPERTFVVTANATYTAKMKDNPLATSHSVTFLDYDGTTLQSYDLIDGRNPVYSGAALNRNGYLFKGWTDANDVFTANGTPLPALTGDVVYTATYVKNPYLTITNKHATTATSVSMKESNTNMADRTYHVRILNAAGEVTTDWTSITVSGTGGTSFGSIPAGGKMYIYGNGGNTGTSTSYYDYFVISGGTPELSGNILGLIACSDGETVNNNYSLGSYCFNNLFKSCTALTSAEDLELPSTTLSTYCYYYMFTGCTGLRKAPKVLPAAALPQYCYGYMFNGCTALQDAPDIQATSITGTYACYNMFYGCTSLVNVQEELHAPSMTSYCYYQMFYNCSSLTTAPALPATTLATSCYYSMFYGCTKLTKAPSILPALALPQYCYYQMFRGCTSLATAPEIEATSVSSTYTCQYMFYGCTALTKAPSKLKITSIGQTYTYNAMFQNCSNLEKAPDILATSQANYCWQNMFNGCSKLKHIRIYYGSSLNASTSRTANWVSSVAQSGVFYCPPTVTRTYSASAIPLSTTYKWTVYSYNVTFIPVECTWKDATNSSKQFTWETDVKNVTDFIDLEALAGAVFYTDAACTSEISVSDIKAALATQKESSAATTKNYYVTKTPTLQTLTWDVNGGSALTGDYTHGEIYSGTDITAPADPTRDGYEFAGWDAGNDGVADEVVTIMPGDDLTYTAIWRQIFTITFKDAENNTLQSGEVTEGSVPVFSGDIPVKASADPDHVWNFTGWTDGNANFTANGTPLPAVTGNTVYTATYAYEMNYLTFANTHASQTLTVQLKRGSYAPTNVTLNYRLISANGTAGAWQTLTTVNNTTTYTVGEIPAGARMQLYGSNLSGFGQSTMTYWKFYFGTTGSAVLSGDLMSIFSGTVSSFDRSQTLPDYAFYGLFYENSAYNPSIVSAKDLKLSATNLGQHCYHNMFYGCSNMTDAPQLSATTLAPYCYQNMFSYCSSMNAAPTLPATTLADYCYYAMFSYCTSLTTAPQLPVTTLTEGCYEAMFQGCTALVNVQNLPGTNLPKNCYYDMFSGCTALITAPEILAGENATVGQTACNSMFNGCTAMTKAPTVLRPRTLSANSVYYNMFLNCTSLQRGPDVWATTITGSSSLYGLYQNASNVRHIRVHFTAWGASSFCSQWVYGVSPTGEFYCPPELPRTYSSTSYWNQAPRSTQDPWTIYSYDVTFVPVGGKWADNTNTSRQFTWRTDKSDIDDFIAAQVDGESNSLIQGWFLDAACTVATTEEAVKADLSVQQTTVTKYVYVRLSGGSSTLTWNFNGGSTTSTESQYTFGTMNEGDPITAPANPTLAGFEFVGWDAGNDGVADVVAATMPSSDLTYTAIWRQIYTITYENLKGASNSNPTSYTVATPTFSLAAPTGTVTGYTFSKWQENSIDITEVVTGSTGNKTITAVWTANQHNVSWVTDGNTLTGDYTHGTTAYGTTIVAPNTPTKNATAEYTYTFNGWSPAVDATMPDNDVEYTATWTQTPVNYTLTWTTDGNALTGDYTKGTVAYGTDITAPNTPTKTGYTFAGWDAGNDGVADDVAATMPAANTTYTAIWTAHQHNVSWVTDGNALTGEYTHGTTAYGTTIVAPATPTKNSTAEYTYTFNGWSPAVDATMPDNDVEYTATWTQTPVSYTLTWTTDGNDLTGDYTHGTVAYGTTIVAPATPTKDATAEYTYAFNGWSPTPAATMPAANTEYTATWTETPVNYTLTWSTDGDELTGEYTHGTVAYGTTIVAPNTPTKSGYTFNGWSPAVDATMPAANTTYTATWTALLATIELLDNENNDYYTTFKAAHHNETANVRYTRTFGQGRWATLCLPFNVTSGQMTALKMKGRVYEFNHATGDANIGDELVLYFSAAKSLEAGKCYIVNANSALAGMSSFTFSNVTINLAADNGENLSGAGAYDALPGYKQSGNIELVGTLRKGTLKGSLAGHTYMGLKDNKIYYPNTDQGSTVLAYRGVFRDISGSSMMERVRIVVDGEDAGELEVVNGELQAVPEARKFIQDGVLYIEREGVIYDATGKLIIDN